MSLDDPSTHREADPGTWILLTGVQAPEDLEDPIFAPWLDAANPKVVSERLGHSSIEITLGAYSHVLPGMQEETAEAFDTLFPP